MSLPEAPFRDDLAEGPDGSHAVWIRADDGLRLRVARFPAQGAARGSVLVFPGRTEYVEKYGRTATDLARAGYETLSIDWRGQGLADRMLADARIGHVGLFSDYQRDVAAMLEAAEDLGLPRPYHLIAHSMGGCIGLRAVMDGLPVASCVFTGPMWGIRMAPSLRPVAWTIGWGSARIGLGHVVAPGTTAESYLVTAPFEDNLLTRDRDMYAYMLNQVSASPSLALGGPSLRWLHQSLLECRALERRPSPDLPCITFLGENERIVDCERIRERMARWPGGRLEVVPEAEHEVLMEGPKIRARILPQIVALFDDAARSKAAAHSA